MSDIEKKDVCAPSRTLCEAHKANRKASAASATIAYCPKQCGDRIMLFHIVCGQHELVFWRCPIRLMNGSPLRRRRGNTCLRHLKRRLYIYMKRRRLDKEARLCLRRVLIIRQPLCYLPAEPFGQYRISIALWANKLRKYNYAD